MSSLTNLNIALPILVIAVSGCAGKSVEGPRRAIVSILNDGINGKIIFEQASSKSPVKIRGTVYGLEPGMHGMHVHEGQQLGADCHQVGPHFNPTGKQHGGPRDANRHVGDLGNIRVSSRSLSNQMLPVFGAQSLLHTLSFAAF